MDTIVGKWFKVDKENSRYGFNYFNSISRIQGITRLSVRKVLAECKILVILDYLYL